MKKGDEKCIYSKWRERKNETEFLFVHKKFHENTYLELTVGGGGGKSDDIEVLSASLVFRDSKY